MAIFYDFSIHIKACFITSLFVTTSVAKRFGLKNGAKAPCASATAFISLSSVENTTSVKVDALAAANGVSDERLSSAIQNVFF